MSINVSRVEAVILNGIELRAGDRVRIRMNQLQRGLSGKIAVIEGFEHDAASRTHVVVRLEERRGAVDRSAVRLLLTLDEIEAGGV
jgi:hypothetical protein